MSALSKHLPTFAGGDRSGAFSQEALRKAIGPALLEPPKPQPGEGAEAAAAPVKSAAAPRAAARNRGLAAEPFTPITGDAMARRGPAAAPKDRPSPSGDDAEEDVAETFVSLIPNLSGPSPKQAMAAKIAKAVAKAQADAAQANAEALEAARQAERERAEERLVAARAEWAREEAGKLHTALAQMKDELMTTLGDAVGDVLAPVFSKACTRRALDDFYEAMAPLLGEDAPPLVQITAPDDLFDALAERVGALDHVELLRSDEQRLTAVGDVTRVEAPLHQWADMLTGLAGGTPGSDAAPKTPEAHEAQASDTADDKGSADETGNAEAAVAVDEFAATQLDGNASDPAAEAEPLADDLLGANAHDELGPEGETAAASASDNATDAEMATLAEPQDVAEPIVEPEQNGPSANAEPAEPSVAATPTATESTTATAPAAEAEALSQTAMDNAPTEEALDEAAQEDSLDDASVEGGATDAAIEPADVVAEPSPDATAPAAASTADEPIAPTEGAAEDNNAQTTQRAEPALSEAALSDEPEPDADLTDDREINQDRLEPELDGPTLPPPSARKFSVAGDPAPSPEADGTGEPQSEPAQSPSPDGVAPSQES